MKITQADYTVLKEFCGKVLDRNPDFEKNYQAAGHSSQRARWDVLYASKIKIGDGIGIKGDVDVYAYADDTHIDTALRSIMKERGKVWAATK